MTIEKVIIQCAADVYGADVSAITPETDIREELSNQSLKLLAFISAIEEELDVKIDMKDAGKLKTIRDFADKVEQLSE